MYNIIQIHMTSKIQYEHILRDFIYIFTYIGLWSLDMHIRLILKSCDWASKVICFGRVALLTHQLQIRRSLKEIAEYNHNENIFNVKKI